jgi:hypothetical protein
MSCPFRLRAGADTIATGLDNAAYRVLLREPPE